MGCKNDTKGNHYFCEFTGQKIRRSPSGERELKRKKLTIETQEARQTIASFLSEYESMKRGQTNGTKESY